MSLRVQMEDLSIRPDDATPRRAIWPNWRTGGLWTCPPAAIEKRVTTPASVVSRRRDSRCVLDERQARPEPPRNHSISSRFSTAGTPGTDNATRSAASRSRLLDTLPSNAMRSL